MLSVHLDSEQLPHQVLNAKQHAREAEIVAQAGRPDVITIATNMAGRGTDIVLGGSIEPQLLQLREDETLERGREGTRRSTTLRSEWQARHEAVIKAGGLHIVGTERHESRRIDNQLRGRSGRQGDPGSSRFYLSLEDPLLRIFGGERLSAIMQRLKMPEGEPIEHSIVNRSIAKAQNRVESRNFDIRKQLLEYDDVANDQRRVIYQQRNELLESDDVAETIAQHDPRRGRRDVQAPHPAGIGRGAVGHPRPRSDARLRLPADAPVARVAEGRARARRRRVARADREDRRATRGTTRRRRSAPSSCASSSAA